MGCLATVTFEPGCAMYLDVSDCVHEGTPLHGHIWSHVTNKTNGIPARLSCHRDGLPAAVHTVCVVVLVLKVGSSTIVTIQSR